MNVTPGRVVEAIDDTPAGAHIGAFFDLDGTLLHGFTAGAACQNEVLGGHIGPADLARIVVAAIDNGLLGGSPGNLGKIGFRALRGRRAGAVTTAADRLFAKETARWIRPQARDIVQAHLRRGHTVAVASSATRMQVEPVARDLGIPHLICTELEEQDGVLTGRSTTGMLWGEPKAAAVRAFARNHGVDLRQSFGYANGWEDIAFLGSVGRPCALNPHPVLRRAADEYGWPVLTLREARTPGPRAYLGTLAALLGVNAGLTAGVAYGLLTGDRRRGMNTGIALSAEAGLALAGVKLDVVGADILGKTRPAVFIANHQSTLDVLVLGALLRRDFTAVAKKEARFDPRMMIIGTLLDPVWIDRANPAAARKTLDGVVRRLRDGTSILILPEGTRMPTPTLGRFKKGAFHIAMQAGVPIVPIVLRNTGELAWRRSMVVNPGTVEVAVLEPVTTDGWTAAGLDGRIAEMRHKFVDTLQNWPGSADAGHVIHEEAP
ncbi:HAD-IB family hydrolase [Actinoplanes sp. NPDC024001]|uniref:HAD-IB family hydrolase n=1 Tax=Actinoplanes sp. NPDC024001 TaxID=3154598 RepID=UPI0033EC8432